MAASVDIRIKLDAGAIRKVTGEFGAAAVNRAADVLRSRIQTNITTLGRVDTGRMRSDITIDPAKSDRNPKAVVHVNAPWTVFQEFGTRGHGPVTARMLRFKPKGSSTFVFARWVRGVPPGRFMRDALDSLTIGDFL